jgi:hypothetical protein
MAHNDYTKNILNIKDENIYFDENCLEEIKINNIDTKVFHGNLLILLLTVRIVVLFVIVQMILLNGIGSIIVKSNYLKFLIIILFYF